MQYRIPSNEYPIWFIFNLDNVSLTVEKSCYVTKGSEIERLIDLIMQRNEYKELAAAGYNRSRESLIREWKGHNLLLNLNIAPSHTESTDFENNQNFFLKAGYWILSLFYNK